MIHITVPESTKIYENSASCDAFKIFINGAYHCTLRYSSLLRLHETLKKSYEQVDSISFPPKKFKYLMTDKELEERREDLECYLRSICQNPLTASSVLLTKFFLEAQKTSFLAENSDDFDTQVTVYMLDGTKKPVHCIPGESTSLILERFAESLGLQTQSVKYFGLFVVTKSDINAYKVVRWLQNFECPSVTLSTLSKTTKKTLKIIVRKCYWDAAIEKELCLDHAALNLLYIQAVSEVEAWKKSNFFNPSSNNKWSAPNEDMLKRLERFQTSNSILEYVQLCQMQPRYGYTYFEECSSDYPNPKTSVYIAFGNRQIILLYKMNESEDFVEAAFRVTRIRSWKLTSRASNGNTPSLSFEYLIAVNHLEWICLYSEQCIIFSLCLQSMVSEIVKSRLNSISDWVSVSSRASSNSSSTGTIHSLIGGAAVVGNAPLANHHVALMNNNVPSPTVTAKAIRSMSISSSVDNEAFNTITDEDL